MMTPVSVHTFFQKLTCSVMFFPFEKLLLTSESDMMSSPRNNVAVLGESF